MLDRPLSVLCVVSFMALAGGSHAQTKPSPPTVATTDRARALHLEGARLFAQAKYDDGYAALLAAWALKKHPQIAGTLAECEAKIGKYRDAAEHFARVVADPSGEALPEEKHLAQQRLREMQAKVATLTIDVEPLGSEVLIDDGSIGRAPVTAPVFVDPGEHKIVARMAGRPDAMQTVRATPGMARKVTLSLAAGQSAAGPNKGIMIGGATVAGVGVAVGVALTIVSAAKGSFADSQLDTLRRLGVADPCSTHMTECSAIDSDRRAHDALAKGAIGAFVGGGAIGLATLGYALLAPKGSATTGARVVPVVGLGRTALVLEGVW